MMSYAVAQRTREIGLRITLGAQPGNVLKMVIGEGMKLALIGVALGLIASFALTRTMKDLLFGVGTTDPLTFRVSLYCWLQLRCSLAGYPHGGQRIWLRWLRCAMSNSVLRRLLPAIDVAQGESKPRLILFTLLSTI